MNSQALLEALRKICIFAGVTQPDGSTEGVEGLRRGPEADFARTLLEEAGKAKMHYHLVFAEVVYFGKNNQVHSARVEVYTKALDLQFPARRLHFINNSAVMQAKHDLQNPKFFQPAGVHILNMYYLGEFTDAEFYNGIQKITEEAPAVTKTDNNIVTLPPR